MVFTSNWESDKVKKWEGVIDSFNPSTTGRKPVKETVTESHLVDQMMENFLEYTEEVTKARSFPSALDGMKSVQRRVLFAGFTNKLSPSRPFVKSTQYVASTLIIHPHGDASAYGSIVAMGRNWTRVPLVSISGNSGLSYGDEPAAHRYTKARVSDYGWLMVEDLANDAVEMVESEDHDELEPIFLPTKFPNLIINGTEGIGTGFVTSVPQHNPIEAMQVVEAMMDNPDISTEEIMEIMPGPDWATGGEVFTLNKNGENAVKNYYETGSGSITVRATAKFDGDRIVITSLPYGVSPESVIKKINNAIINEKVDTIKYAKDLSSEKNGTMLEIIAKKGISPQLAFEALIAARVGLESNFAVHINVLDAHRVLKHMSIKEVFSEFISSRYTILNNILRSENAKASDKKHLLDGVLLIDIDKAVKIIRESNDANAAKKKLKDAFKLDDIQADYILSMTLRRLTKQDRLEIEKQIKELEKKIKNNEAILGSKVKQKNVLKKQAAEVREIFEKDEFMQRNSLIRNKKPSKVEAAKVVHRSLKEGSWGIDRTGFLSNKGENIEGKKVFAIMKTGDIKIFNGKGLPKKFSAPIPVVPDPDLIYTSGIIKDNEFLLIVSQQGKIIKIDPSTINGQGVLGSGVAGMKYKDNDGFASAVIGSDDDQILTMGENTWKVTNISDIPVKGRGGFGVGVHTMRKGESITEAAAGKEFIVNSKKAKSTARAKSGNKGSVSSWKIA